MEIMYEGEMITVDADEYNEYRIGKATNTGYDD